MLSALLLNLEYLDLQKNLVIVIPLVTLQDH